MTVARGQSRAYGVVVVVSDASLSVATHHDHNYQADCDVRLELERGGEGEQQLLCAWYYPVPDWCWPRGVMVMMEVAQMGGDDREGIREATSRYFVLREARHTFSGCARVINF